MPTATATPVLLADLIRDGKLMWTFCRRCNRERDIDPATIPLPGAFPVPDVGKACGARPAGLARFQQPQNTCAAVW